MTHVMSPHRTLGAYNVLVGKPEEKRSLGRLRRSWEDNIKMSLQKVIWRVYGLDWCVLICMRLLTFGLHKMRGIYRLAEEIFAQERLLFQ